MTNPRFGRSLGLLLGSSIAAAAACTSASDATPSGPDASTPCATSGGCDASAPPFVTGGDASPPAADDASPNAPDTSSADDAPAPVGEDAAPEASTFDADTDGGVIIGCVPQEVSTRYDATWIFGSGCRADWNASNVVTFSASNIHFSGYEGTISAANASTGALFAASDGINLYDGTGTQTNTTALGGNASASQAVAFIGVPGSASDFYVVTNAASSGSEGSAGLYWSLLSCGSLVPTGAPQLIAGTSLFTEALATVRNADNVDRWVLSSASAGIAVLPVTASGGFGAPTFTPWSVGFGAVGTQQRSFISFARDRHTFVVTAENVGAEIGQFDNATGTITALAQLPLPPITDLYSAAFSPDGTKVYVSSWEGSYYQVDLSLLAADLDAGLADAGDAGDAGSAVDAGAAVTLIGSSGGALRLAIDDQLYVASYDSSSLAVVTNPNAPAASLVLGSAALPSGCTSSYGFPGIGDL